METNRDSRLGIRDSGSAIRDSEFGILASGENHSPVPGSPLPTPHSPLPSPELFELAPEEIEVCLRLKGPGGRHQLLHYLRPPAFEDWREYERNLRSTVESVEDIETGGEETLRFDSCAVEAAAALYDRLFRRAHGYRAGDSSNGIPAAKIPLHHKELVVRGLSDVAPATRPARIPMPHRDEGGEVEGEEFAESSDTVPFALDAETVEVRLEATRAGQAHRNLAHVFRPPSAADRVEYSRVHSQALYLRGSHTLKSLLPSRLPGMVALYDKLVLDARGYAVAGQPLTDRAALVRHMDPLHKKVAAQMLFEE